MQQNLPLAATGTDDVAIDLDLRDEERFLAVGSAEYDPEGVRMLLAAINLQPSVPAAVDVDADVTDLAIFRATGSLEMARVFGSRH